MLPLLKYTVFRLALFVAVFGAFALAKAGLILALVGAAAVSFLLSYLFLSGPREQLAEQIAARLDSRLPRRSGAEEDAAAEDAEVDGTRIGPEDEKLPEDEKPEDEKPEDEKPEDTSTGQQTSGS